MEIRFNVTGSARKELVGIISKISNGCKPFYKGMPSAAYEVADITISKDGTVKLRRANRGKQPSRQSLNRLPLQVLPQS